MCRLRACGGTGARGGLSEQGSLQHAWELPWGLNRRRSRVLIVVVPHCIVLTVIVRPPYLPPTEASASVLYWLYTPLPTYQNTKKRSNASESGAPLGIKRRVRAMPMRSMHAHTTSYAANGASSVTTGVAAAFLAATGASMKMSADIFLGVARLCSAEGTGANHSAVVLSLFASPRGDSSAFLRRHRKNCHPHAKAAPFVHCLSLGGGRRLVRDHFAGWANMPFRNK